MISTVKRKRKYASVDQVRKKTMRKNLDDDEKDALRSTDKERKKEIRKHLDDDEKNVHHTEFYLLLLLFSTWVH